MAKKSIKERILALIGQESEDEYDKAELSLAEEISETPQGYENGRLPPLRGSLLQVWENWAGFKEPPALSLAAKLPEGRFYLDPQQLANETMRMENLLEQDAKRRLKTIKEAEEKGVSGLSAECRAYVSKDKMICWAFIFPPVGEEGTLPLDGIGKALQESEVTSGIDPEALLKVFQEKPYFDLIPIAIGTPVVEGENGRLVEYYERELPLEIKIDEDGVADYKYTNYVRQIYKDDVICDIIPPTEGRSGLRVDGVVIQPKAVRPARIPKGSNTVVSDDGLHLIAAMDGHLEYKNRAFQIRPVLNIQGDVDYSIGNIDFIGDVHIKGDVRENFRVSASGSVTIDGLVEASTVEAGGDLTITRGVVGDNRALLRSSGCVRVKYLENCVVYAGKGVFADCIMNSQVFSDSSITVTSGRGSIIGGSLTATQAIRATMIGAESGRRTELMLGALPYVQSELQNIKEDIIANRREREDLERSLAYLEREQGLEGSDARLAKSRMRLSVLMMKEQQLLKRQQQLEPLTPDLSNCYLECNIIYPITRLVVKETIWVTKDIKRRCKVRYNPQTEELKESFY